MMPEREGVASHRIGVEMQGAAQHAASRCRELARQELLGAGSAHAMVLSDGCGWCGLWMHLYILVRARRQKGEFLCVENENLKRLG
jgi:hypothetical protein